MNTKRDDAPKLLERRRAKFWRNSTYEEPLYVSLAWIIIPLLIAGILIYVVVG